MPYSMTGWGTCRTPKYTINIRGLNSKYREIMLHLPQELFHAEPQIHKFFAEKIARGRVDVYVSINRSVTKKRIRINEKLFDQAYRALKKLAARTKSKEVPVELVVNAVEDILQVEDTETGALFEWKKAKANFSKAADDFMGMKRSEGARLAADIKKRAAVIRQQALKIKKLYGTYKTAYIRRAREKMEVLFGKKERAGFINREAVEILDRMDVNEEIVRLFSHVKQVQAVISAGAVCGRKLDFIAQEIYREANTIGSKTQDNLITGAVIVIKENTEKIREQAMNLE